MAGLGRAGGAPGAIPRPARSLFVDEGRLTAEARQSLRGACPGPLCVELHNYSQARAHLQRYAQGNVTVWLGTEYTTYGLYGVIPQVRMRPTGP